ncbi:MAG: lipid-A-disaccharide synthase [Candidatus Omnitrophica bacterium]|nr:lipid-A-disaccharide synthase [Candidatus Omnitrophota bacterium]MDD5592120.1 lipid-A-disaccharide synthase [Candidatus Omnitrophota bacterium]
MENPKNILIVAGEASGDLHASCLVKALKNIYPQLNFFGLGGEALKKEGVNLYFNLVDLAVVGFFEVLKNLKEFREVFCGILREVDKVRPDLAILVDYPGFNLRLAGELKKRNIPIIYYISPQVWAWGENRIEIIGKLVKRMLVVFKFEEALYQKHNIPVSFVGHPLLDIVRPKVNREELFRELNLDSNRLTLALLPGSREKEVKALLPVMLDSAALISKGMGGNTQFLILRSTTVKEDLFKKMLLRHKALTLRLVSGRAYDGLAASDFALVASGTATLETAILGIPMVILYKVSFPTWAYLRMKIRIPYIGLVNVVKGEKIIEEFIQYNARPRRIAGYIIKTLKDKEKLSRIREGLSYVAASLGEKGASMKAAQIVAEMLR